MKKITEIIVGTNNIGKYGEICNLLPNEIKKYSPKDLKILTLEENGKSFEENSMLKASYFSKKITSFNFPLEIKGSILQKKIWKELKKNGSKKTAA